MTAAPGVTGAPDMPVAPGTDDGGAGTGVRPTRPRPSPVRSRHWRAHVLVAGWAGLALLAAAAHDTLPMGRWLAVHLFLLGAATTAILVWSEHFAVAMLHTGLPDQRWSTARLAGVGLGTAGVLLGVRADLAALVTVSCLAVVGAVAAHLVVLVRMGRGRLGGQLAPVVGFYRVAAGALVVGVVLGGLLATGATRTTGPLGHTGLGLAHLHVTLLGWIGLPVLGTLLMLWPTVLGVPPHEDTARTARRVLALTGGGLTLAVAGFAAAPASDPGAVWRVAPVAGLAAYAAGVALLVRLFTLTARRERRTVSTAAVWSLAAGAGWLPVALAADIALCVMRDPGELRGAFDALVPLLLLGFVAQVLIGAMTYLLPVVLAGRPDRRAAARTMLERAWRVRIIALNLAVALLALPQPGPVTAAAAVLAAVAAAAFLALVVAVLARRDDPDGTPSRAPALFGTALGAAVTVLAVLVANSGTVGGGSPRAAGTGTGGGAGVTRTVTVTLGAMRITPDRIEVPSGTALRLKVTNRDAQRHDLKVEDGPATPLLADGESRTLDLGTVTADRTAWCTLPGHRAAGMTLDIAVTGTTRVDPDTEADPDADAGDGARAGAGAGEHSGHAGAVDGGAPDLGADFSDGWRPRQAALPAAPSATVHRLELHAVQRTVEVAPGVRQEMWTFGGTAPGPTLRGTIGDLFEITLVNDDPALGHGIDFHAGALAPDRPMRTIRPGERLVYRFRAERAGAWLYHCGTMPMLQHIGNGMYGAVVIDPPDLAPADREYVLVSSQLYLGTPGSTAQVAKMRRNTPDAWMFNGAAAQYAKAPLSVRAGERVRFWVVAAGPSDGVSFHVVGTIFDTVYKEGAYALRPGDPGGSQTLDLAAAQGGFVETVFPEAGHYSFVDHDMRRAEAGAQGTVEVR